MLLFHSQDESALLSWQSGVYYADGTPKSSLPAVRDSLDLTRGGSIARCDGLALDVRLTNVRFPGPKEFTGGKRDTHFRCTLDCSLGAEGDAHHHRRGRGDRPRLRALRAHERRFADRGRLGAAPLRLPLTVTQAVNPGASATRPERRAPPAVTQGAPTE